MIFFDGERTSDSPLIERVWRSHSEGVSPFLSVAVNHCEFVVSRLRGRVTVSLRGPETKATPVGDSPTDGEWFGVVLKLGTFVPHLPTHVLVDGAMDLPNAACNGFWFAGSVWPLPDYDNAEAFVARLARAGLLQRDPVAEDAFYERRNHLTERAVQYHFPRATGITLSTARQIERARHATLLLRQGVTIPDTIQRAGYYDQPHLTRSLRRYIGQTPAQLLHHSRPEQLSFLYKTTLFP